MDSRRYLRYTDSNTYSNAHTNADTDAYSDANANANANANAWFCVQPIQRRHGRCKLEYRRHAKHGNRHIAASHQRHAVA